MSLAAVPSNARSPRPAGTAPTPAPHSRSDHGVLARAHGIRHAYGNGPAVLRGIDHVLPGHFTALIGPSGSGKSTLMRMFNGLVRPVEGTVVVSGVDLTKARPAQIREVRRSVGMVFQQFNLVRRLSALENVLVGRLGYLPVWRSTARRYPRADVEVAVRALARVGLERFACGAPTRCPAASSSGSASRGRSRSSRGSSSPTSRSPRSIQRARTRSCGS
jgi:phosphonate transport system ATP-binding protein